MRRAKKTVIAVLATALLFYGAVCAYARVTYRRYVYPAPPPSPVSLPEGASMVEAPSGDGHRARFAWFPAPPGARTIVLFHGNAETIADDVATANDLRRRGFGVALAEYRGYGPSTAEGPPSERALFADAGAVLDALAARGVSANDVVLWGTSLGTGVAVDLASRGLCAAVVLVSPYTSLRSVASRIAWFLPMSLVMPDAFDSLSRARAWHLPTLVIHGTDDALIPFDMGRRLCDAMGASCTLVAVEGAGHNDVFARDGAALMDRIASFAGN